MFSGAPKKWHGSNQVNDSILIHLAALQVIEGE